MPSSACQKTVAVLGSTGFIGRHLCARLVQSGYAVRAVSRRPNADVAGDIFVVPDLHDVEAIGIALAGCDRIVHLADEAGRLAAPDSQRPIAESLARAIGERPVRLVYASSIYARLSAEGQPSAYGERKRRQETILRQVQKSIGLRLPPVYGPGCGGSYAMLQKYIARGIPLPFGLADAPRSYLSVANLCALIDAILAGSDAAWKLARGKVFEPDDGARISTRDLASRLASDRNLKARLFPVPRLLLDLVASVVGKRALVSGAFDALEARDTKELTDLFGWEPRRA